MKAALRLFLAMVCGVVAASCSSGGGGDSARGTGGADGGACPTGLEACACYGNHTCESGLTCASNICVRLDSGSGGGGAPTGTGGVSGGMGGTVATGTGGTAGPGTGGIVVGGTGGTVAAGTGGTVVAGTGGASGCSCTAPQECTTDGHCVDPKVIDDFADCNTAINMIRGRNGGWYSAADVGINVSFAVGVPPSGFADRRCGAWTTGGPTGNGTTSYALVGAAMTTAGTPADLRGYAGIAINLEAQSIDFTLKTTNGGYFTKRLPKTSGTQTLDIAFADLVPRSDSALTTLNLATVTDLQFTVIDPTMGYGFVIHGLSLY